MDPKSTRRSERTDYVFVAPDPGRRVLRVTLFLALVGLCVGLTLTISDRDLWTMVLAGVSAVGLVVCWAMLAWALVHGTLTMLVLLLKGNSAEGLVDVKNALDRNPNNQVAELGQGLAMLLSGQGTP